jgi:hypothetical protein
MGARRLTAQTGKPFDARPLTRSKLCKLHADFGR